MSRRWIGYRYALLLALLFAPRLAIGGSTLPVTFDGNLSQDDDVGIFQFTITETSDVVLESQSFEGGSTFDGAPVPSGGFDPIITLFDAAGNLIDEEDGTEEDFTDFRLALTLDAGTYTAAISQFDNFANGPTLADGFFYDGEGNFTIVDFCEPPATGPFCDDFGNQRTSFYSFDVLLDTGGGPIIDLEIILVGFEDLSEQTDDTGVFDPGSQQTVFRVFDDAQAVVATATGELAASAGIVEDFINRYFTVGSSAGTPQSPRGSLVVADFPGIGATSGELADLFASPQDLRGGEVSALVRDGAPPVIFSLAGEGLANTVRGVLRDADGNEFATATQPLTSEFQNMQFNVDEDFGVPVGGALAIDLSRIAGLRFEFFSAAMTAPASSFDIDDVQVAPEPAAEVVGGTAIFVLVGLANVRRRRAQVAA